MAGSDSGRGKKGARRARNRSEATAARKKGAEPEGATQQSIDDAAALRDAIQEKSARSRAERESAKARAIEEAKRRRALVHALHYCCYAEGDELIAAEFHDGPPIGRRLATITVDSLDWASRMVDLAAALRQFPELLADIRARPIPDKGAGIDAGRKLFDLALDGTPPEVIAGWIDEYRTALGPWEGQSSGQDARDSELGVWAFLSQLARFCDGYRWELAIAPVTLDELAAAAQSTAQDRNLEHRINQWYRLHEADHPAIIAFLRAPGSGSPTARAVRRIGRARTPDEMMTIALECESTSDADFRARVINAHRIAGLAEKASWPPSPNTPMEMTLAIALAMLHRRPDAFDGPVAPLAAAMEQACAAIITGHGGWNLLIPMIHALECPKLGLTRAARATAPTMAPHPRAGGDWTDADDYAHDGEYWPIAQAWWHAVRGGAVEMAKRPALAFDFNSHKTGKIVSCEKAICTFIQKAGLARFGPTQLRTAIRDYQCPVQRPGQGRPMIADEGMLAAWCMRYTDIVERTLRFDSGHREAADTDRSRSRRYDRKGAEIAVGTTGTEIKRRRRDRKR